MASFTVEDRTALRDGLHRLLSERCTEADVRRAMETPEGYDRALWKQLADMGVVGLIAPEEFGGAGASAVELELVMEEAGAALQCGPLLSSGVLAISALLASGDRAAQQRLLPAIAGGTRIAPWRSPMRAAAGPSATLALRPSARGTVGR